MGYIDEKSFSGLFRESFFIFVDNRIRYKYGVGKFFFFKQFFNGKEGCFGIGGVKYCFYQKDICIFF